MHDSRIWLQNGQMFDAEEVQRAAGTSCIVYFYFFWAHNSLSCITQLICRQVPMRMGKGPRQEAHFNMLHPRGMVMGCTSCLHQCQLTTA